jgi:hypothetical protein
MIKCIKDESKMNGKTVQGGVNRKAAQKTDAVTATGAIS